ncbi:AraC-type DNA-binding protein [Clostridium sp. USBA 49]|uniref:AraC family transcriptional regulator n=1 Tax=Clostridium sp. USBA 49 TaxID=1881060 RepID=UPI000998EE50|nr:AraC family transcriptional regulator [Clostridium sp. USBA 49]SKA85290.1 AraC-type DNA-binding protein [Clostridium sp. USBA 49]
MSVDGFINLKQDNIDLTLHSCGKEDCKPSHSYGPAVRDHFLIHYIIDGKGIFHIDNKTFTLTKNQGFVIFPNILTYYEADFFNPWFYTWVGFTGFKAETYLKQANISRANPIFTYKNGGQIESYVDEMIKCQSPTEENELKLHGLLFLFLSELVKNADKKDLTLKDHKDIYIKKSIQYIEKYFADDISICDLAKYVGLNRSYLSSLFKNYVNMSPQEFLINYRINKAIDFMSVPSLSISEISRSVGYEDPLAFSKIFKKIKGFSPKKYRENLLKKF